VPRCAEVEEAEKQIPRCARNDRLKATLTGEIFTGGWAPNESRKGSEEKQKVSLTAGARLYEIFRGGTRHDSENQNGPQATLRAKPARETKKPGESPAQNESRTEN
jgi:hypothetical protein